MLGRFLVTFFCPTTRKTQTQPTHKHTQKHQTYSMFALKLPSQIKAGAAETLHSEKKARGELTEIVDPTAHLAWKRNKGGPVWGTKGDAEGQQANPTPLSPGVGPGDKVGTPGWGVKTVLPVVSLDPELKVRRLCDPSPYGLFYMFCVGV